MGMSMSKATFESVNGKKVFFVPCAKGARGLKKRNGGSVYSTHPRQKEVYQDDNVSLHIVPPVKGEDWTGVRLYLVNGRRRKVWHFGVCAKAGRAARVSDYYHLRVENPAMAAWAVDFVCGDSRRAPPWDDGVLVEPSVDEILDVIRYIELSSADGVGWSFAVNTRKRGRYVVDNLKGLMPECPHERLKEIVIMLAIADVVYPKEVNSHTKRACLHVNRGLIADFLRRHNYLDDGEGEFDALDGSEGVGSEAQENVLSDDGSVWED